MSYHFPLQNATPVSNVDPPPNIDLQMPTLDAYSGPLEQQQQLQMPSGFGGGAQNAPGAGEMNAAYKVSVRTPPPTYPA